MTSSDQAREALAVRRVTALLEAGVPLTLLLDLADAQGPPSQEMCALERPVSDAGAAAGTRAPAPRRPRLPSGARPV